MAFTMRGAAGTLTWDNGTIGGDPDLVLDLQSLAEANEGDPVGPIEGPVTFRDHLASDISAMILMAQVIPGGFVSGEVPERPAIPEGAIG